MVGTAEGSTLQLAREDGRRIGATRETRAVVEPIDTNPACATAVDTACDAKIASVLWTSGRIDGGVGENRRKGHGRRIVGSSRTHDVQSGGAVDSIRTNGGSGDLDVKGVV